MARTALTHPTADRQRAAVPALVADQPDADTLADMPLGEAL